MKKIFFLSLTLLFFIPEILADKRAPRGECYVSIGYVNDRAGVAEFAKNSFIKPENFELFEREDKKVYLTLGKIDENLFKKLQSQNKTYDFNCSRGKGYEVRLGLNSDFQIIGGNKINIVSAEQFISVVSSIEIEKQRLVDLEVEKQVQARMAALEKERVAKEAAEKERQRLAELERKRKAEEEAEKEKQRLAELERQKKAAEEAEKEKQRLAKIAAENEKASSLGFNTVDDMNLAIAAGFEDANAYNSIANELNQAFAGSGLSKKEWLLALNSLGGKSLLNSYRSFQSKDDWSAWIKTSYKFAANIPKLLLKCNSRNGYYVIAHTFSEKPTADFLYVSNGQFYARKKFYNVLGTRLIENDAEYSYPDFKFNISSSILRYKNWEASVNRNSGSFVVSHETENVFYNPDVSGSRPYTSDSAYYDCSAWNDIKRYQDLKSDYIKFTKAEAARKKEKAEAEAKAKLESRKF